MELVEKHPGHVKMEWTSEIVNLKTFGDLIYWVEWWFQQAKSHCTQEDADKEEVWIERKLIPEDQSTPILLNRIRKDKTKTFEVVNIRCAFCLWSMENCANPWTVSQLYNRPRKKKLPIFATMWNWCTYPHHSNLYSIRSQPTSSVNLVSNVETSGIRIVERTLSHFACYAPIKIKIKIK